MQEVLNSWAQICKVGSKLERHKNLSHLTTFLTIQFDKNILLQTKLSHVLPLQSQMKPIIFKNRNHISMAQTGDAHLMNVHMNFTTKPLDRNIEIQLLKLGNKDY